MSVKLLDIDLVVNLVFKRYPSTYCLMQGIYFICSKFQILQKYYLNIRSTTF